MLYKFKSKAASDVIMTGPVGDSVLRAMGREPAARGILEVAALSSLLLALEKHIADDESGVASEDAADKQNTEETGAPTHLNLAKRSWPLVEMMKRSLIAKVDIVWGV